MRLFALDQNFPDPIVSVLAGFQADAELVRVDAIDPRLAEVEDWQLLLALHHHDRPWDGLITTDSSMLNQGPELATLIQTKLTLVVAAESGHNPVKASGLLFAHLGGICKRTEPGQRAGVDPARDSSTGDQAVGAAEELRLPQQPCGRRRLERVPPTARDLRRRSADDMTRP